MRKINKVLIAPKLLLLAFVPNGNNGNNENNNITPLKGIDTNLINYIKNDIL